MKKPDTQNIFRKLSVGLLSAGILSYSLLPSEGMKYLWKEDGYKIKSNKAVAFLCSKDKWEEKKLGKQHHSQQSQIT